VLTGYLGSGKTTLLRRILAEKHGKRYAVIQNEFGAISIDDDMVVSHQSLDGEDIFHTTNGCLCCTVRTDLVPVLSRLYLEHMKAPLDGILLETTGLANPSPVVQTFSREPAAAAFSTVDAVVTTVDCVHAPKHLSEKTPEFVDQIIYADVILLNKMDLMPSQEAIDELRNQVQLINPHAAIVETIHSNAALSSFLDIGAFDLDRIGSHLKPIEDEPQESHAHAHTHHAHTHHAHTHHAHTHHAHDHHAHHDDHHHDRTISSVSLQVHGVLCAAKLEAWLGELIGSQGENILRSKGLLYVGAAEQSPQLLGVQSVHMLFQGDYIDHSPEDPIRSRIVFIGRHLDPQALYAGFESCLLNGDEEVAMACTSHH